MKLNEFLKHFEHTGRDSNYREEYNEVGLNAINALPELKSLLDLLQGAIFESGLFKIHNIGSFYYWTQITFEYFKEYKGKSYCFAFDWAGRQYAVNYFQGKTLILLLDPATGEAFELESDIESFLNTDLDEMKNELLELEKFNFLRTKLINEVPFDKCFGFKKFLLLGGKDQVDNFEIDDIEVYWELKYQIFCKTKNLALGSLLDISIK